MFSCKKKDSIITPAFYYWQSTFHLNTDEINALDMQQIKKLYIKFFDITWDKETKQPKPDAIISFATNVPANIGVIPVIFITNETFENLNNNSSEINALAAKISKLIETILSQNNLAIPSEIQFDCDWTEKTKNAYFLFLETMKHYPAFTSAELSATIRLHQIKYFEKTGVPPVNKGMLMFYNMGNIEAYTEGNSIFDEDIALQYTDRIESYPLPLDAAIACYSWGLLFENSRLLKIYYPLYENDMVNDSLFEQTQKNIFIAKKNFYFGGYFLNEGDAIKIETMSPKLSLKSAQLLASH
jgi:hypothetical protein